MSRCALALFAVLLVCGCFPVCNPNLAELDEVIAYYEDARRDPNSVICFKTGTMYSDEPLEPMRKKVAIWEAADVGHYCRACSVEQSQLLSESDQSFCAFKSIVFVESRGQLTVFDTPGSGEFRELMQIDGKAAVGASCFKSADVTLVTPWWRQ